MQTTYVGGIVTILLKTFMVYTVVSTGVEMVKKMQPYILSTVVQVDTPNDDKKYYLSDMNTLAFSLVDTGSWPAIPMRELEPYI